jgi:suppressor of ftsI/bilirubin oxidase
MPINRRNFLKYTGLASMGLVTTGLLAACGENTQTTLPVTAPASTTVGMAGTTSPVGGAAAYATLDPRNLANFTGKLLTPGDQGALGILDLTGGSSVEIGAKPATLEILNSKKANLLTYQVAKDGKNYINPILRLTKGDTFAAILNNGLSEDTNLHWHGLHVPSNMDGHPSLPVLPGAHKSYSFKVQNRGGTYWYHPHPHQLTPKQAYSGLASFFVVEDEDNQKLNAALDLKLGETDLPIVIQDKLFDSTGQLVYQMDANTQFMGFYGDTILANLTPNASLDVASRLYRLRLLNGSNARTYLLAFTKGNTQEKLPYLVIGTDGGLLDKPYQVTEVFLSPGERIEVLLDFKGFEVGETAALKSLAFDPMHNEMGGMIGSPTTPNDTTGNTSSMGNMGGHSGMMGSTTSTPSTSTSMTGTTARLDDGVEFFILKFTVKSKLEYNRTVPPTLASLTPPDLSGAKVRPLVLSQAMMQGGSNMMQWLIDGKSFQMDDYPISVTKGGTEIWEFKNESQSMPHPMHLHGFPFQVVERQNSPGQLKGLATYSQGRLVTDLGWKDTVLVWPGETVRLAIDFSHDFEGEQLYVTHCHVLEHEDNGMMLNYKVV